MKIRLKIATQANAQYLNCNLNHIIEIDFEEYIARVVASEIGNASLEACKAQAIAARTFAVGRGVLNGKEISDSSASAQACRLNRTEYENANKAAKELSVTTTAYTDAALIFYQQGLQGEAVTERTDVDGVVKKILTTDYVKEALENK